jgi:hypothetical protein
MIVKVKVLKKSDTGKWEPFDPSDRTSKEAEKSPQLRFWSTTNSNQVDLFKTSLYH